MKKLLILLLLSPTLIQAESLYLVCEGKVKMYKDNKIDQENSGILSDLPTMQDKQIVEVYESKIIVADKTYTNKGERAFGDGKWKDEYIKNGSSINARSSTITKCWSTTQTVSINRISGSIKVLFKNINKKCAENDYIEATYEYIGKCNKEDRAF